MLINDTAKLILIKDALVQSKVRVSVTSEEQVDLLDTLLAEIENELAVLELTVNKEWILHASYYGSRLILTDLTRAKREYLEWVDGVHDYDDAIVTDPDFEETITLTERDTHTGVETIIASKTTTFQQMI